MVGTLVRSTTGHLHVAARVLEGATRCEYFAVLTGRSISLCGQPVQSLVLAIVISGLDDSTALKEIILHRRVLLERDASDQLVACVVGRVSALTQR